MAEKNKVKHGYPPKKKSEIFRIWGNPVDSSTDRIAMKRLIDKLILIL